MVSSSKTLQAMGLMLLSMAGFAAMSIVIRLLSAEMHSALMVTLRNAVSLLLIIAWAAWLQRGLPRFPTARLNAHFWRASVGIVSMELWFYCLTVMPLTLATALSFTTPIFSTIFAIVFLGEKAGLHRWSAVIFGFIGVLIVLHPGAESINPLAALVLMSSAIMAVAGVLIKTLSRTEPPETMVFYMALFMLPWSLFPAFFHLQPVTPYQLWLVFLIALFSTIAHLLLVQAFRRADMVVLMPFDFTRLLFVAVLAYVLFGETMDESTAMGALAIVASTVYIAHREARKKAVRTGPAASGL